MFDIHSHQGVTGKPGNRDGFLRSLSPGMSPLSALEFLTGLGFRVQGLEFRV